MIGSIRLKICGLRRPEDASLAASLGADYLGFIVYAKSPRALALDDFTALAGKLPSGPEKVAVLVEPCVAELTQARDAGFDRFQIHAQHDVDLARVRAWSAVVSPDALWLAAKVPPGAGFPEPWLDWANTFLVDTFHPAGFGGSGQTGDWSEFARLATAHPAKRWALAGGLSPANICEARAQSGARLLDVNSGVEISPGVKSAEKLQALAAALAHGST
ncbi:MAG: phosphoribosylanthranilate isomerase [Verrucomicrobia bacterium]|nr:MAG: phosphoribosylanthranilate isomerase [Verrucomicrobiota bacterium]